eukprot:m51a1_g1468 hypothetical protein (1235) ;mRNA; f:238330-243362
MLMTTYEKGLNPVEFIAGLMLLARYTEAEKNKAAAAGGPPKQFAVAVEMLREAAAAMHHASAAYGWKVTCGLMTHLMEDDNNHVSPSALRPMVHDTEQENIKSLLEHTGVPEADIYDVCWKSGQFSPGHYVVVDRKLGAAVVSFRGTWGLKDSVADLVATPAPFTFRGVQGCAHSGVLRCALKKVVLLLAPGGPVDRAVEALGSGAPKRLIVTGHSLGGGVSTLFALIAAEQRPQWSVRCYAFAPAAALTAGLAASSEVRAVVTSFLYRDDLVPRLSMGSLNLLKATVQKLQEQSDIQAKDPQEKSVLAGARHLTHFVAASKMFGEKMSAFIARAAGGQGIDIGAALRDAAAEQQQAVAAGSTDFMFPCGDVYVARTDLSEAMAVRTQQSAETSKKTVRPVGTELDLELCQVAEFIQIAIGPNMFSDHLPHRLELSLDHLALQARRNIFSYHHRVPASLPPSPPVASPPKAIREDMSVNKTIPFATMWATVGKPLGDILSNFTAGLSPKKYMELYTSVFQFVSSMNADNAELYKQINILLKQRTDALVKEASPMPDEQLLVFFVKQWEEWSIATKVLNHLMAYLNRTWIKNQRSASTSSQIYEISMAADMTWRDSMLIAMREKLTGAMLRLIRQERDGQTIQDDLIRNCLECYKKMGLNKDSPKDPTLEVYKEHFEVQFLAETEIYYAGESQRVLHEGGVQHFMRRVQERLNEETDRVKRYLNCTTEKPLLAKLEQVLIAAHKEAMHAKFRDLLKDDLVEDLKLMYALLARVENALEPLKGQLEEFIRGVGLDAIAAERKEASEKPEVFVNILLRVFRKYTSLIQEAFRNDPAFVAALDKAFREFVNKNAVTDEGGSEDKGGVAKAPQILAKYCDAILRRGSTYISDETEMERTQTDIVALFKYFPDKDVFMLVYSKLLSKRLISDQSASEDAEQSMIGKLKVAQGFEYCMKLQRMMTDMQLSKSIDKDFQEFCESSSITLPFSFNIFVLATGSWPLQPQTSNFQLPTDVMIAVDSFKAFYDKKYQGRKLTYLHHLSRAELEMPAPAGKGKKKYILQTTTYQMGTLLLFNGGKEAKLRDLQAQTQLQDSVLRQNLLPLVNKKILTASDTHDSWGENTEFAPNMKFASERIRISCIPTAPAASSGAGKAEAAGESAEIMRDRVLKLQAAIVRIMKARKTLNHTELVQETINQVSRWFAPQIQHIKKAIESLIEQDYIKRSKDASGQALKTYEYVA